MIFGGVTLETFEFRDTEINADEIMSKIRENIKKRKESGAYPENEIEALNKPFCTTSTHLPENTIIGKENVNDDLNYINSNWDIQNNSYFIGSHRPILGKALIIGRQLIHDEIRRYVDPMVLRQTEFNECLARILNDVILDVDGSVKDWINQAKSEISANFENRIKRLEERGPAITATSWENLYGIEVTEDTLNENIGHHEHLISLIREYAAKSAHGNVPKLLEVGLGTATMSIYLSRYSYDITGIDNVPAIVEKAIDTNKKLGGYAKFILMDAFNLDMFKDKYFDVAFSQGTMEHFDNHCLIKLISKQLAVSKFVIFSVPSIYYPYNEFGNERRMSIGDWELILKNAGYNILDIKYYHDNWFISGILGSA